MRITGGRYVRRRVECPPGEIRPAMDRMRESLFAILGDLEGLSFLDLFSGSGVIGIEAASRGAEPVILVERDPKKRTVIERNIGMVETRIRLVTMSAERFILSTRERYDLIFLDPPFAYERKGALIESVGARQLLSPTGLLLIHYPRGEVLPERATGLGLEEVRRYGRSWVSFYRALAVDDVGEAPPALEP